MLILIFCKYQLVLCDKITNYILQEVQKNEQTPKYWHRYVLLFFMSVIEKHLQQCGPVLPAVDLMRRRSKVFRSLLWKQIPNQKALCGEKEKICKVSSDILKAFCTCPDSRLFYFKHYQQKLSDRRRFSCSKEQTIFDKDLCEFIKQKKPRISCRKFCAKPFSYTWSDRPTAQVAFSFMSHDAKRHQKQHCSQCVGVLPRAKRFSDCNYFGANLDRAGYEIHSAGWTIRMEDPNLSLNISFIMFDIPVRSTLNCSSRYLNVSQLHSLEPFQFCGKLPHFYLYLSYKSKTTIELHLPKFLDHAATCTLLYTVIDRNLMQSIHMPVPTSQAGIVLPFCLVNRHSVQKYFLVTDKMKTVTLKVPQSHSRKVIAIYDGPGDKSTQMFPKKQRLFLTSFQCLIVLYNIGGFYFKENHINYLFYLFKVASVHQELKPIHSDSDRVLILPGKICNRSTCVFGANSTGKLHVKLTVNAIKYNGMHSQQCAFGGLTILESRNDTFLETASFCHSHKASQDIYSSFPQIAVGYYWYKHYSTVQVNITVAETNCSAVNINPCLMRLKCAGSRLECTKYLKQLSNESEMYFSMTKSDIVYFQKTDKCTVIQIRESRNDTITSAIEHCLINMSLDTRMTTSFSKVIHHQIQGQVTNSLMNADWIYIVGIPNKYCFLGNDTNHTFTCFYKSIVRHKLFPNCTFKNYHGEIIPWTGNGHFYITAELSSRSEGATLKFLHIGLFGTSHSWMNIKVWTRKQLTKFERFSYLVENIDVHQPWKSGMFWEVASWQNFVMFGTKTSSQFSLEVSLRSLILPNRSINCCFKQQGQLEFMLVPQQQFSYLRWTAKLYFEKHDSWHLVSLPGMLLQLDTQIPLSYLTLKTITLRVAWQHVKKKFGASQDSNPCVFRTAMWAKNKYNCQNFSDTIDKIHHVNDFFLLIGREYQLNSRCVDQNAGDGVTWKDAFNMCEREGGHLPAFFSMQEIDDFTLLMKVPSYLYAAEMIYLGLLYHNKTKVTRQPIQIQFSSLAVSKHYFKDLLLFQSFYWPERALVGYQQFHSHLRFEKQEISRYSIRHTVEFKHHSCTFSEKRKNHVLSKAMQTNEYPVTLSSKKCVAMFLGNLASPRWLFVQCNEGYVRNIICSIPNFSPIHKPVGFDKSQFCVSHALLKNNSCFFFKWSKAVTSQQTNFSSTVKSMENRLISSEILLELTGGLVTPVVVATHQKDFPFFQMIYDIVQKRYIDNSVVQARTVGFQIFLADATHTKPHQSLFSCQNKIFMTPRAACDDVIDCPSPDDSDEKVCHCNLSQIDVTENLCKIISVDKSKDICSPLFNMSKEGKCFKYVGEQQVKFSEPPLSCGHADGLVWNCEPAVLDVEMFNLTNSSAECVDPNEIPCIQGHTECFNISSICQYSLGSSNITQICRNGAHLQNCTKFECNKMFKCPQYYCIPFPYQCDGKWDCPTGADESDLCLDHSRCSNMFRCKISLYTCIHLGSFCDGIFDCPSYDDEQLCEIINGECPTGCQCLILAIFCSNSSHITANVVKPFLAVTLHSSPLILPTNLSTFEMVHLTLLNAQISAMCKLHWPQNIVTVKALYNPVILLSKKCFCSLSKLITLDLKNNFIKSVKTATFHDVPSLKSVNLSNNHLTSLPQNLFFNIDKVCVFSVLRNHIHSVDPFTFQNIEIETIETNSFYVCCVALKHSVCNSHPPLHISCHSLLQNSALQTVFVVMSVIVCAFNTISLILHLILRNPSEKQKAYFTLVVSDNMIDLLFGCYLSTLCVVSKLFDGFYAVSDQTWRSSFWCFFVFALVFIFCVGSPCLLFLISFARMQVVRKPMDTKFKDINFVCNMVCALFLISVTVAAAFTVILVFTYQTVISSLCLPFVDPANSVILVKVATIFVALLHVAASFGIIVAHISLFRAFLLSQTVIQKSGAKSQTGSLLFQLIIISSSNLLSWISLSTIHTTAMFMSEFPHMMLTWSVATVDPLNSIVLPAVYVFTGLRTLARECGRKVQ